MSEKPTVAEVQRIVDSYFSENIWSGKNTLTPHNNPPKRKKRRNRRKP
jgi:hypothetical protein